MPVEALFLEGANGLGSSGLGEGESGPHLDEVGSELVVVGLDGNDVLVEASDLGIVSRESLLDAVVVVAEEVLHLGTSELLDRGANIFAEGLLEVGEEGLEVRLLDEVVALIVAIITSTLPRASRTRGHAARRGSNERGRPPEGGGRSSQNGDRFGPAPNPHLPSTQPPQVE